MKFMTAATLSMIAFGTLAVATPSIGFAATGPMMADTDNDGTLDMAEAKKAAMSHFAMSDADHEGTLDSKEAGMDVTSVDGDKDGTVDKAEYEKALAATFKSADTDGDGTIDAKEMQSSAGQMLAAMIK